MVMKMAIDEKAMLEKIKLDMEKDKLDYTCPHCGQGCRNRRMDDIEWNNKMRCYEGTVSCIACNGLILYRYIVESVHLPEPKTEKKKPNRHEKDSPEVKAFRAKLEAFAIENGLKIADVKGWTEHKIRSMALDPEHRCACDPKNRTCPCEKSVDECNNDKRHMCRCSVFEKVW